MSKLHIHLTALTIVTALSTINATAAELVIYTSHGETTSAPVLEAFKKTHPDINVTVVRGGTGDVVERIRAETANPTADVLWGGPIQTYEENTALFQPFQSDTDASMVTIDPQHIWHPFTLLLQPIMVSTKRVPQADMPTSQADLAHDKWKKLGALIIPDPARSGTGYTIVSALAGQFGWNFINRLVKDARIAPGSDDAFNAIRDGEAAIGWINEDLGAKWTADGLPIKIIYPTDAITGQIDAQAIVANAPHIEQAKIFIDFLGSKTAHERVRDATIRRSARMDIAPPAVLPNVSQLNIISPQDPKQVVVARFQAAVAK
ncbi:extracellular solute-binding protein [Dickeya zeae]|uniref:extracellular solute-binding protein n=1 Tax=Dickeya zeae TaxID=204042 RepID=UPI0003C7E594|nr:extracellular solute-binding protein [Dickeya zeae]